MNLEKLYEKQEALDLRIVKDKNLEGADLSPDKLLALIVELGELANEWRGFKFWSNDQEPIISKLTKIDCPTCRGLGIIPFGDPGNADTYDCEECDENNELEVFPLLEEYVDGIHFLLSIGLENGFVIHFDEIQNANRLDVKSQFIDCFKIASNIACDLDNGYEISESEYIELFSCYWALGEKLGFTGEEITQAYHKKNAVNHKRQEEGY